MGDDKKRSVRLNFHSRIRIELHGAQLSSDGGLLAYRELDERLGLTTMADASPQLRSRPTSSSR